MFAFNFVVEYTTKATDAMTAWFHIAVEKVTTDPLWGGAVVVFILAVVVFLILKKKAAG